MSSDTPPIIHHHSAYIGLADGRVYQGQITTTTEGWLHLTGESGDLHCRPESILWIAESLPAFVSVGSRKTRRNNTEGKQSAGPAGARSWTAEELRQLAEGFLDGELDRELYSRFGCTMSEMKRLRHAFECARGNDDEDRLDASGQAMVSLWREVLSGA